MVNPARVVVFDMDGVLVNVAESYRETIQRTVEHFTGRRITRDHIQHLKNTGDWNDDWKLSHKIIGDLGGSVDFESMVDYFQSIFLGNGGDGLIQRERWIAHDGLLEQLNRRYRFAMLTGRPREEAELTLKRFAPHLVFDPLVGMYDVERHKPAPDGLLIIREATRPASMWYVGDTVSDARCARAAGVDFIGIASPSAPRAVEVAELLRREGAIAVLDDINHLPEVLV